MSGKLPLSALVSEAEAISQRAESAERKHAAEQILATLKWLEKWEPVIRSAVEKHKKAMAVISGDPVAQQLQDEFPDAGVEVED